MDPNLDVGHEDEAAFPAFHSFGGEDLPDALREGQSPRHSQAHQHQAVVGAGRELAQVREIQILGDEKPLRVLRRLPNLRVGLTGQVFQPHVVHVVTEDGEFAEQEFRQVFVQLDLHKAGKADAGRSSSAEAAA